MPSETDPPNTANSSIPSNSVPEVAGIVDGALGPPPTELPPLPAHVEKDKATLLRYLSDQERRLAAAQAHKLESLAKMPDGPARTALLEIVTETDGFQRKNQEFQKALEDGASPSEIHQQMIAEKAVANGTSMASLESLARDLPDPGPIAEIPPLVIPEPFVPEQHAIDEQNNDQSVGHEAEQQAPAKKSRFSSVRDTLRGAASTLRDAAGDRLHKRGSEQKLSDVADAVKNEYKAAQKELSELQKQLLDNMDPSKMTSDSPSKIDPLQDQVSAVQAKMADMRQDNPGLKQLDRSKVGQVVHSGVRDAAKSIGNKLKS